MQKIYSKEELDFADSVDQGDLKKVHHHLQNGMDPDFRYGGQPMIHRAASMNRPLVLILLFEAGADYYGKDDMGNYFGFVVETCGNRAIEAVKRAYVAFISKHHDLSPADKDLPKKERERILAQYKRSDRERYPQLILSTILNLKESGREEEARILQESLSKRTKNVMNRMLRERDAARKARRTLRR